MKKNGMNSRERREAEKAKKDVTIREINRQKQMALEKEEAARKAREREAEKQNLLKSHPEFAAPKEKKSKAKIAGVKSTFTINGNELLMTSFGKGNQAVPEKKIKDAEVTDLNDTPAYSAEPDKKRYAIAVSGRANTSAIVDDPGHSSKTTGADLIDCRKQLERRYFGREFEDNIHIQLIYNILDLDKILAPHVNNIVYELNNMLRNEDAEYDDLIGYLSVQHSYETFVSPDNRQNNASELNALFNRLMSRSQLGYFGTVLYNEEIFKAAKKNKPDAGQEMSERSLETMRLWEKEKARCYYLLCLLGTVRQAVAHGRPDLCDRIYQLEPFLDTKKPGTAVCEVRKELDVLYSERVNRLNAEFLKNAAKDLVILFRSVGADDAAMKKQTVREYYDFVVRKEFKNIGFSIRHLRELMIELTEASAATDHKKYDTVRARLNRTFDFVIYRYYMKHSDETLNLVAELRASGNEIDKELVYRKEAKRVWNSISDTVMNRVLPQMTGQSIAKLKGDSSITKDMLDGVEITNEATYYSKMIYFLTRFLNGKEINDLLTTLINKFENIVSLREVMIASGLPCKFEREYSLFDKCGQIASELRCINSFARMVDKEAKDNESKQQKDVKKTTPSVSKEMFMEAAQILGYQESDEKLRAYVDSVFDKNGGNTKSDGKKDTGFRNFIINNVIKSDRFRYLVRYSNPKKVRALASNQALIGFVLKDIPDTQVVRYYNSCFGTEKAFFDDMRPALAEVIANISFNGFENVNQKEKCEYGISNDKTRKQTVIRLYLAVMYLITKNLVYVNARYFTAFHCMERDAYNYDAEKFGKIDQRNLSAFAVAWLETHRVNRKTISAEKGSRSWQYRQNNIRNADPFMITQFRNCVDHLGAVRNADRYIGDLRSFSTWFEIYHYIVQRYLKDQFNYYNGRTDREGNLIVSDETLNEQIKGYLEALDKYGTYCKDFVKTLTVPFAYNLPRYKNLSVNELFDRNHPMNGETKDVSSMFG